MTPADEEPLIINGRRVSRGLLAARPMRRCELVECQSYCCSGGVYIHTRQADDILAHQELIQPHLPPERRDPALWFAGDEGLDTDWPEAGHATATTVVPDPTHPAGQTCIFLLPESRWCALQTAGIASGQHPWRFKPFYCALHPLGLDDGVLQLVEQSEMYLDGGSCNRSTDGSLIPVYRLFEPEVKLVLGEEGYAELDTLARRPAPNPA